jgi:hypothetical protein
MIAMRRALGWLVFTALVAACATKVASTQPGSFSSLDPSRRVSSLDHDSQTQLCQDIQLFGATALTDQQLWDYLCAYSTRYDCPTYDACVRSLATAPNGARGPLNLGACGSVESFAASCTLTVGELQTCLFAQAQWYVDFGARVALYCDPNAPPGSPPSESDAGGGASADCLARCDSILQYGFFVVRGGQP